MNRNDTHTIALRFFRSLSFVILFLLCVPSFPEVRSTVNNAWIQYSGIVRVTTPDQKKILRKKNKPIPEFVSGMNVEVLRGTVEIAPPEGMAVINIRGVLVTVKKDSRLSGYFDPRTTAVFIRSVKGEATVMCNALTLPLKENGGCRIYGKPPFSEIRVETMNETVEARLYGRPVTMKAGTIIDFMTDTPSLKVHMYVRKGSIQILNDSGTVSEIIAGGSIVFNGMAAGETQTMPGKKKKHFRPRKEPAELMRPEASAYRP